MDNYDFAGWATKYNMQCSDGRTIMRGAFLHCDNAKVPLVWNHTYDGPDNIIGHAVLQHRDEGVYALCSFNDTETAQTAKALIKHGDISALSIHANKLKQQKAFVSYGDIKEVSLVVAGANPGAFIQEVLVHGDNDTSEATIYHDDEGIELSHSDDTKVDEPNDTTDPKKEETQNPELQHKDAEPENETVADIYDTLTDKQKNVVAMIIDQLSDPEEDEEEKGDTSMKHNVFDNNNQNEELKHFDFAEAAKDAKRVGSLKEAILMHSQEYGIENIDVLFPDAVNMDKEPGFIDRDQAWVGKLLAATHKTPFSRIKKIHADITPDSARAKGYIKGNLKKEEVFALLKRTTEPTTIYKKQKLDRDDIIDITDFDVVSWLKREMRGKLDEELARAILIGDGRLSDAADKIKEACIRPIASDSELYTIRYKIDAAKRSAKELVRAIIKSREDYEGTGLPNLYLPEGTLIDMLMIEDTTGRFIYANAEELAKTLRVREIISVPVMKNVTLPSTDSKTHTLECIMVNPADYTIGANKGGEIGMFDDFDIDFNQYKYLIETRCSGSLTEPKSAISIVTVS